MKDLFLRGEGKESSENEDAKREYSDRAGDDEDRNDRTRVYKVQPLECERDNDKADEAIEKWFDDSYELFAKRHKQIKFI